MSNTPSLPETPILPKYDVYRHLKGQKAIVTGANSGIRLACAVTRGKAGADVIVNYVSDHASTEDVAEVCVWLASDHYFK